MRERLWRHARVWQTVLSEREVRERIEGESEGKDNGRQKLWTVVLVFTSSSSSGSASL